MASVLHNYEAIIKDADSTICKKSISIDQLYDQLQDGVFLNSKKKKFWVERKFNNCFFLYARDLYITWGDDPRYWKWTYLKETSDEMIEVAQLLKVSWLDVQGKFDTRNLSLGIVYQVAFVVMLKDDTYDWEAPVNLRLILPDGTTQQHEEYLGKKPRKKWIEIPAGVFISLPEKIGEIKFSLYEHGDYNWKIGLIVKGVVFKPKY